MMESGNKLERPRHMPAASPNGAGGGVSVDHTDDLIDRVEDLIDEVSSLLKGGAAPDSGVYAPVSVQALPWVDQSLQMLRKFSELHETLAAELQQARVQIAEQQRMLSLQREHARTDALTGVANRREFEDVIRRRIAESFRQNSPLTLILVDADRFKSINDNYGHTVGDTVLRCIAQLLQETIRISDHVARFGGEEFVVVLPATELTEGTALADRLRRTIAAHSIQTDDLSLQVTISCGVAQLEAGDQPQQILTRADKALYCAKALGRNRVEVSR